MDARINEKMEIKRQKNEKDTSMPLKENSIKSEIIDSYSNAMKIQCCFEKLINSNKMLKSTNKDLIKDNIGKSKIRFSGSNQNDKHRILICIQCSITFESHSGKEKHLMTHHGPGECSECGKCNVSVSKGVDHRNSYLELNKFKNIHCRFCRYSTNKIGELNKHHKSAHLKIKDFKCNVCSYETEHKRHMITHVKAVHCKIKDIKCQQCPYAGNTKSEIKQHTNSVHNNIKPYHCMKCSYSCSRKYVLRRHVMEIHEKIKEDKVSFQCNLCTYMTGTYNNLNRHARKMHINNPKLKNSRSLRKKVITCKIPSTLKYWEKKYPDIKMKEGMAKIAQKVKKKPHLENSECTAIKEEISIEADILFIKAKNN